MEGTPGLELLFRSAKSDFKSDNDVAVCLLHWNFIANGFRCIGTGEESETVSEVESSELLPEGWNQSQEIYTLRYELQSSKPFEKKERYLLKVILTDGSLIVNIMNLPKEKLASKIIKPSDYVTNEWNTTYSKAFKNVNELKKLFNEEMLKEVTPSPSASKQEEREPRTPRNRYEDDDDPLRIPSRLPRFPESSPRWDPLDPFSIGRADLDPFSEGGGMIFDPLRTNRRAPPNLPRGLLPPGARYDPIGPGRRGGGGPDPDHLPLPNSSDYDDMFM